MCLKPRRACQNVLRGFLFEPFHFRLQVRGEGHFGLASDYVGLAWFNGIFNANKHFMPTVIYFVAPVKETEKEAKKIQSMYSSVSSPVGQVGNRNSFSISLILYFDCKMHAL